MKSWWVEPWVEARGTGYVAPRRTGLLASALPRLAQHITYVHQHSRQPPAQFEPLDMKLMR